MLKNYIKIAWRNLLRNKGFSTINILGLAAALAVFIIIALFLRHETSYDQYFSTSDRVYRLMIKDRAGSTPHAGASEAIINGFRNQFPEIEEVVMLQLIQTETLISNGEKQLYREGRMSANSGFFDLFPYTFIDSVRGSSLDKPNSIVLTRSLARDLFGNENALGETVRLRNKTDYTVTGVIEDPPSNTHLTFTMVTHQPVDEIRSPHWHYATGQAYLLLRNENSVDALRLKLSDYVSRYARYPEGADYDPELLLQPVTEAHLYPNGKEAGSSKMVYISIFVAIAVLILIMACINYINLETARSVERAREIAVRKTVGADRFQLSHQILTETFLTVFISFIIALLLVEISMPYMKAFFGISLSSLNWITPEWISILAGTLIIVAFLSGAYCAVFLSGFNPTYIFRGGGIGKIASSTRIKKILVVAQFAISLAVITATVFVMRQMDYVQNTRLDGQDERLLVLHNRTDVVSDHFDLFKQKVLSHSAIEKVAAGAMPGELNMWATYKDTSGNQYRLQWVRGTPQYPEVFGLDLITGRYFDSDRASDSTTVIINESAARQFGIEHANGQYVDGPISARVIGIVEDYHVMSLYDPIQPTIIALLTARGPKPSIFVQLREGGIRDGVEHVTEVWDSFETGYPARYSFLDQELDEMYKSELLMSRIFGGFSAFSILIACLGIFGLAAYTSRSRTKEIGIRKVLGATVSNIVMMLSKDFLFLVGLGFILAVPIAWYGLQQWLQNFAYKIELDPFLFAGIGMATLLVALLTVSWQSITAALANPVDSLRTE